MPESLESPKYAVIKWKDWTDICKQQGSGQDFEEMRLKDAEVIRKQDITAAPIFHHYASQIATFIELGKKFGLPFDFSELEQIRDHFHNAALDSENLPVHKIPDL
jgi:hypothetical protein